MRKLNKTIIKIAGLCDALLLTWLTYFWIRNLLDQNYTLALLALIADGVWCSSCSLGEIRDYLKEQKSSGNASI